MIQFLIKEFKSPIFKIALFLFATIFSFAMGYRTANIQAQKKQLELANEVYRLELELEQKSAQVVTEYVDRIKEIEGKTKEIIKNVPIYITKEDNSRCTIPDGFVRLHNSAASHDQNQSTAITHEATTSASSIENKG